MLNKRLLFITQRHDLLIEHLRVVANRTRLVLNRLGHSNLLRAPAFRWSEPLLDLNLSTTDSLVVGVVTRSWISNGTRWRYHAVGLDSLRAR